MTNLEELNAHVFKEVLGWSSVEINKDGVYFGKPPNWVGLIQLPNAFSSENGVLIENWILTNCGGYLLSATKDGKYKVITQDGYTGKDSNRVVAMCLAALGKARSIRSLTTEDFNLDEGRCCGQ